jgi:hypothetical protein
MCDAWGSMTDLRACPVAAWAGLAALLLTHARCCWLAIIANIVHCIPLVAVSLRQSASRRRGCGRRIDLHD